jgi:type II secretory pathway predicted ATPase ExeA
MKRTCSRSNSSNSSGCSPTPTWTPAPRSGWSCSANPPCDDALKQGHFAALDQRIGLRFHLDGLPLEETAAYIAHHLTLAGRSDPLFSDDAVALIHQTSRGIPRAINNLAIQALIAAYADNKGIVDESAAKAAVTETTGE